MQVGIVFFSAWLIINGHLSAGTLVATLVVAGQITGPVQALSQMVPLILGSKETIEQNITLHQVHKTENIQAAIEYSGVSKFI